MPKRFSKIRRKTKSRRRLKKYRSLSKSKRRRSASRRKSRRKRKNIDGSVVLPNVVIIEAPFDCGACTKAKNLCNQENISPIIYKETSDEYKNKYEKLLNKSLDEANKDQIKDWGKCIKNIATKNHYTCYPRVFVEDVFIGGYINLEKFLKKK